MDSQTALCERGFSLEEEVQCAGNGTQVTKDAFTLSKPNKKGIITIEGTGHYVSGTGIYHHVKGAFKYSGTSNIKTRVVRLTVTGTISL